MYPGHMESTSTRFKFIVHDDKFVNSLSLGVLASSVPSLSFLLSIFRQLIALLHQHSAKVVDS